MPLVLALVLASASVAHAQPRQPFDAWLEDLRVEARARGYTDELLGQTLAGLTPPHRRAEHDGVVGRRDGPAAVHALELSHVRGEFDGDGRRDIWTSPADTLASIANYLRGHGWRSDEP